MNRARWGAKDMSAGFLTHAQMRIINTHAQMRIIKSPTAC
jgi:hypothetical protein